MPDCHIAKAVLLDFILSHFSPLPSRDALARSYRTRCAAAPQKWKAPAEDKTEPTTVHDDDTAEPKESAGAKSRRKKKRAAKTTAYEHKVVVPASYDDDVDELD